MGDGIVTFRLQELRRDGYSLGAERRFALRHENGAKVTVKVCAKDAHERLGIPKYQRVPRRPPTQTAKRRQPKQERLKSITQVKLPAGRVRVSGRYFHLLVSPRFSVNGGPRRWRHDLSLDGNSSLLITTRDSHLQRLAVASVTLTIVLIFIVYLPTKMPLTDLEFQSSRSDLCWDTPAARRSAGHAADRRPR